MNRAAAAAALAAAALALAGCHGFTPTAPAPAAPASPSAAASAMGAPAAAPAPPATGCTVTDGRADTRCTPGALNPQVTQADIASTICKSGWTATVRPPTSYTDALKRSGMAIYHETGPMSAYEEDHLVSLEIGGSPTSPSNLWPESYAGSRNARVKDQEEDSLHRAVCGGRMTLSAARAKILSDWTHS